MGCCQVVPGVDHPLSDEETVILGCESNLRYSRHKASKIAELIKCNSAGGKVSENQFNTIVETLGLNIQELDTVDSSMFKFYRSLRAKGSFDMVKLLVLGAMLGTGPVPDKVAIIFPQLPNQEGGFATKESVQWLLDTMFGIAIKSLPILAKEDIPGRTVSEEQLEAYSNKLVANEAKAKQAALILVMKARNKISPADLIAAFDGTGNLGQFLKPVEIRTYVLRPEFGAA